MEQSLKLRSRDHLWVADNRRALARSLSSLRITLLRIRHWRDLQVGSLIIGRLLRRSSLRSFSKSMPGKWRGDGECGSILPMLNRKPEWKPEWKPQNYGLFCMYNKKSMLLRKAQVVML